jgi:3-phenylpropionate/cinnamic acid dioxygenase small subunit
MTHMRILAVAAIVTTIGFASTQLGAQDNAAREARDRNEIEALMWRYTRALDTANAEAYAAAYTPDGQFKMVADIKERQTAAAAKGQPSAPMYHMTMNHQLTFVDKDHARIEAYWQTVFGAQGQNTPVRVAAAGRSIDQLVRVNGQWLIQSRDVAPKD